MVGQLEMWERRPAATAAVVGQGSVLVLEVEQNEMVVKSDYWRSELGLGAT